MNLHSDEIQDDNLTSSEEERRANAIEEIAKMATLGTSIEEAKPRFLPGSFLRFFRALISIPIIGEFVTSIIALIPLVIFGSILIIPLAYFLHGYIIIQYFIYILIFIFIFILIPIAYWWFILLEREVKLVVCLPIPFIQIPIKHVLYPFMYPFFGIRYIYQKLRSNRK